MGRVFWMSLTWLLAAAPCGAAAVLELGSSPVFAIHAEGERFSAGLGLGAQYQESLGFTEPDSFFEASQVGVWILRPSIITRLFLGHGNSLDAFLEARVERDIALVDEDRVPDVDVYEAWGGFLGAGFRTRIHERVRLGGAAGAFARVRDVSIWENVVDASTAFHFFLQYEL